MDVSCATLFSLHGVFTLLFRPSGFGGKARFVARSYKSSKSIMKIRRDLETFEEAVEKARRTLMTSWLKAESPEGGVRMTKRNIEPLQAGMAKQGIDPYMAHS